MVVALTTLRLDHLDVVHAGQATFPLGTRIRALAASDIPALLEPMRR